MKAGSLLGPAGRADRQQVTALPGVGDTQPEIGQHLHPAGPHKVPAGLVTRKGGLVGQRHPRTRPGKHQRGDAASRTGADHHRVEAGAHRASTIARAKAPVPPIRNHSSRPTGAGDLVQRWAQPASGSTALPPWTHGGTGPRLPFVTA